MLTGALSGYISDALGYGPFFTVVMLATVPAFIITWFIPFTYPDSKADEIARETSSNNFDDDDNRKEAPGDALAESAAGE